MLCKISLLDSEAHLFVPDNNHLASEMVLYCSNAPTPHRGEQSYKAQSRVKEHHPVNRFSKSVHQKAHFSEPYSSVTAGQWNDVIDITLSTVNH